MKNLIIITLTIILSSLAPSIHGQTNELELAENIQPVDKKSEQFEATLTIPAFPDFDPKKFFLTEKGKLLEKLWMNEGFLEEFYTQVKPEEAQGIKEHPSFKIRISNTLEAEKIGPIELFLISTHFVNLLESDKNGNLYIKISEKIFYVNVMSPLQAMTAAKSVLWSYKNGDVFFSK